MTEWTPGPAVPDYDGPSLQCAAHVIATKRDGEYVCWSLFDRMADGSLKQRFGGSSFGGDEADDASRVIRMATDMLKDDNCRGR
jgi:hypothetical protein